MKLVVAIVQDQDASSLVEDLTEKEFNVIMKERPKSHYEYSISWINLLAKNALNIRKILFKY